MVACGCGLGDDGGDHSGCGFAARSRLFRGRFADLQLVADPAGLAEGSFGAPHGFWVVRVLDSVGGCGVALGERRALARLELLVEDALQEGHGLRPGDCGTQRHGPLQHVPHIGPGLVHRRAQPCGGGPAQVLRIAILIARAPRRPGLGTAERGEKFQRQPERFPDTLQSRHGGDEPQRMGRVDAYRALALQIPVPAHRFQSRIQRQLGTAVFSQPCTEMHQCRRMQGRPCGREAKADSPPHVVQAGCHGGPVGHPLHHLKNR